MVMKHNLLNNILKIEFGFEYIDKNITIKQ